MTTVTELGEYRDERGNTIECTPREGKFSVTFRGRDNRLVVHPGSALAMLSLVFHGDGGRVEIGHNNTVGKPSLMLRVGGHSSIVLGNNLSTTTTMFASAVEGARITVGNDVMAASHVQLRTDDSHGIYDVRSGARLNPASDIRIGRHVWLGYETTVLGGVRIGAGSVLGIRSIATKDIPNNCIAVGSPARVVRRDIAWERPYLWLSDGPQDWAGRDPADLPAYWALTAETDEPAEGAGGSGAVARRRRLRRRV